MLEMIAVESLQTATVMLCAVAWGTVVEMSAAHAVKAGTTVIPCLICTWNPGDVQPFLLVGSEQTVVQASTQVDDFRRKPLISGPVGSKIFGIDYFYK